VTDPHPRDPPRKSRPVRSGALAITYLTKLVGLAIGFNEGLLHSKHDSATMAFAAVLIAGGQGIERVALHLIDKIFAPPPPDQWDQ
jgi:hypothetical protein